MTTPSVTVVIPAFNAEAFVGRAVESALAQAEVGEVVVVDDASQDATGAVVERIADRRVVLVRHRRNAGVSVARNTGLARATAPVVALLDHDDELLPGSVAVRLAAFDTDVGAVAGRVEVVGEGDLPRLWPAEDDVGEVTREQLLAANCVPLSGAAVRRDLARAAGGFDPRFPLTGDYGLWLRLVSRARVCVLPDVVARLHRDRPTQSSDANRMYRSLFAMLASLVPEVATERELAPALARAAAEVARTSSGGFRRRLWSRRAARLGRPGRRE